MATIVGSLLAGGAAGAASWLRRERYCVSGHRTRHKPGLGNKSTEALMSGGRFDYIQFRFHEIVEDIRTVIANNDSKEKTIWGQDVGKHLPPAVLERFEKTADTVERAEKMVNLVDLLLSGDHGEESFLRRWREEGLDDLNAEVPRKHTGDQTNDCKTSQSGCDPTA